MKAQWVLLPHIKFVFSYSLCISKHVYFILDKKQQQQQHFFQLKDVLSLGGVIAKQPIQATHLIVNDRIDRTAKLLKCFSTCEFIINKKWIIDSKEQGKFIDLSNDTTTMTIYQIKDEQFEKHYNCVLNDALQRARENRHTTNLLFKGFVFYLSPSVRPSHSDLEEMIRSAGGQLIQNLPSLTQLQEPFRDDRKTVSF